MHNCIIVRCLAVYWKPHLVRKLWTVWLWPACRRVYKTFGCGFGSYFAFPIGRMPTTEVDTCVMNCLALPVIDQGHRTRESPFEAWSPLTDLRGFFPSWLPIGLPFLRQWQGHCGSFEMVRFNCPKTAAGHREMAVRYAGYLCLAECTNHDSEGILLSAGKNKGGKEECSKESKTFKFKPKIHTRQGKNKWSHAA